MTVTRGRLLAVLVGAGSLLPAAAQERQSGQPAGWRVRVSADPIGPKQGLYAFNVTVRDASGNPVDDAEVFLRLHSFDSPGYRLALARRVGRGWYRGSGHLKAGLEDPRYVRAVVRPGERSSN